MSLDPSDDTAIHAKTAEFDWRESYYCNFFDPDSRLYGTAWQGVRPNQRRGEVLFLLFENGEPLIYSVDTHLAVAPDIGAQRLAVGNQRFECLEPWSHWQVHYDDGAARATVDWRQFSGICDWDYEDLTRAKHYEASGRVSVRAEVDGRSIAFEGLGCRDRAWGPRNYGPLTFSWWLTMQFPDEVGAHVFAMYDAAGKLRLHGLLHRDGVSRPGVIYEAEVEYEPDSGPPRSARHRLVDDLGRELVVDDMSMMKHISFATESDGANLQHKEPDPSQDRGLYYWTWQRYVRDDGTVGHGMIDLNCWRDRSPTTFRAEGPHASVYDYGIGTQS